MEYLLIGLGNPGEAYATSRHNLGRVALERMYDRCAGVSWRTDTLAHARVARGVTPAGTSVTFVLPDTFMNRSGVAVRPFVERVEDLEHVIVLHDDIDLPEGTVRIAFDRGSGGHNGVRSVERMFASKAFVRVRIGIAPVAADGTISKPAKGDELDDFVLRPLRGPTWEKLLSVADIAARATIAIIDEGREAAMLRFHSIGAAPRPAA
ncbi:MAG: aminoacyl-tRNA hydrolase [Candidatus Pacebacteria bacterium]|nr:aminoacyl-tRNA hydrolase [Candidatus Paceibacterota bacterium]